MSAGSAFCVFLITPCSRIICAFSTPKVTRAIRSRYAPGLVSYQTFRPCAGNTVRIESRLVTCCGLKMPRCRLTSGIPFTLELKAGRKLYGAQLTMRVAQAANMLERRRADHRIGYGLGHRLALPYSRLARKGCAGSLDL